MDIEKGQSEVILTPQLLSILSCSFALGRAGRLTHSAVSACKKRASLEDRIKGPLLRRAWVGVLSQVGRQ